MTIECAEYREYNSGALIGFATFWIPKWGVEIKDCSVFSKDKKRWVSLPSKEYQDKDTGEKKYSPFIWFREKGLQSEFNKAALQAVDDWVSKNTQSVEQTTSEDINVQSGEKVPF